jgi:endonuclease/exonuclease/phosphatase family metal-dependent hydrolase
MADGRSRLRVVQLNIGSVYEAEWARRRHEIVAWLDELQPDIVCLEEVWESATVPNTAGWLAEHAAGEWHWVFGGAPMPLPGADPSHQWGLAVLSRHPIDEHQRFALPLAGDAGPAPGPVGLLHARTGDLDVFAAHLAAAPTDALHRRAQVLAIDEHVRAVRGDRDAQPDFATRRASPPAILCGDFNAEPDSDEIRFLSGLTALEGRVTFWQDAWRVAGDAGPGHTQDWRTHPLAADLNVHRQRIDYVFVGDPFRRAGDAGRVLSARVVFDEPRTGIQASDHRGLLVEVQLT